MMKKAPMSLSKVAAEKDMADVTVLTAVAVVIAETIMPNLLKKNRLPIITIRLSRKKNQKKGRLLGGKSS